MSDTYISKEKVFEIVCEDCNKVFPDEPCEPSDCELLNALRSIPAADVRPVVRGTWEEEDSASNRWSFRCSVCGEGGRGYKFNFCPNCGADMRLEPPKEE